MSEKKTTPEQECYKGLHKSLLDAWEYVNADAPFCGPWDFAYDLIEREDQANVLRDKIANLEDECAALKNDLAGAVAGGIA